MGRVIQHHQEMALSEEGVVESMFYRGIDVQIMQTLLKRTLIHLRICSGDFRTFDLMSQKSKIRIPPCIFYKNIPQECARLVLTYDCPTYANENVAFNPKLLDKTVDQQRLIGSYGQQFDSVLPKEYFSDIQWRLSVDYTWSRSMLLLRVRRPPLYTECGVALSSTNLGPTRRVT